MIRVLFLGPLQDLAGCTECEMHAPLDWEALLAQVPSVLAEELRGSRVHVACAGKVLADKIALQAGDGDEVALLPPVSGG